MLYPISLCAGCFCFDENLRILAQLKYSVDSSTTPFVDWETDYSGMNFQGCSQELSEKVEEPKGRGA